jgi:hypothetical protein
VVVGGFDVDMKRPKVRGVACRGCLAACAEVPPPALGLTLPNIDLSEASLSTIGDFAVNEARCDSSADGACRLVPK